MSWIKNLKAGDEVVIHSEPKSGYVVMHVTDVVDVDKEEKLVRINMPWVNPPRYVVDFDFKGRAKELKGLKKDKVILMQATDKRKEEVDDFKNRRALMYRIDRMWKPNMRAEVEGGGFKTPFHIPTQVLKQIWDLIKEFENNGKKD